MSQDYRLGEEVEVKDYTPNGTVIRRGKFEGVKWYDVKNNATRRLLRKLKGEVKPQNWRNEAQRWDPESGQRIHQIGELVDMKIGSQWVPGTIENIIYKINMMPASNEELILSYLQVHRIGQPWPQAQQRPATAPASQAQAAAASTLPVPNMDIRNLPEFQGFELNEQVQVNINGVWKNGTIVNFDIFTRKLRVNIEGVGVRKINPSDIRRIEQQAVESEDASVFTFPHTTVNRNNMPAEARDVINIADENINEFIAADPRNKIFKFMDAYHAINADDFESYFLQGEKKNENTFYACKRVIGGLGVGEQDVNVNKPLFSLRNMGFTDYVLMDEFESALQSPNQYFEIMREGATIAPSLSSYYSIHGPPAGSNESFNLSSRFHCQEGIQSNIYKLAILDIVSTGGRRSKALRKTKKRKAFVSKTKKKAVVKLSKRKTKRH